MAHPVLRAETEGDEAPVGTVELFFDLIFVFAVTQLSHQLLIDLNPLGALEAAMMLAAVWWVWVMTTWASNVLNPGSTVVRLLLFAMMGAGLVVSTAIPTAFGGRGMAFAVALVLMQLSRSALLIWAFRRRPEECSHYARIAVWLTASGALWIAGPFLTAEGQMAAWGAALAVDYLGPVAGYWLPGRGRVDSERLDIAGEHMAERVGLFMIIALGESILVTGLSFSDASWNVVTFSAAAAAVTGAVAMWWIYFGRHADAAAEVIEQADNPAGIARRAYTYAPLIMVAGIVVTAVGDELVLEHPDHAVTPAYALTILGGPALFLIGAQVFKWLVFRMISWPRVAGAILLLAAATVAHLTTPLIAAWVATGVMTAVGVLEYIQIQRGGAKAVEAR